MLHKNLIQVSEMTAAAWLDGGNATSWVPASEMSEKDYIAMRGPICVVDDDDWVCDSVSVLLETYGYEVLAYGSGEAFLRADGRDAAKCLIIDQHMPGLDGLDVVEALRRDGTMPPTILITGRLDAAIVQRADQLGILAVLEKPFATGRFIALIRDALGAED